MLMIPLFVLCSLFASPAGREALAKALYSKIAGDWEVVDHRMYAMELLPKTELGAFHSLRFSAERCDVLVTFPGAVERDLIPWPVKVVPLSSKPEFHFLDKQGRVAQRVIYRMTERGELQIAIGLDRRETPRGFDTRHDKIILLSCNRTKSKK